MSQNMTDNVYNRRDKLVLEAHSLKESAGFTLITEERRAKLDMLYKAFVIVSEGSYVYLCDMKYDYSRWSKSAVDAFGLPSEYMYGVGDIWENRIHPEDRMAYHKGIEEIFAGKAAGHDMQYFEFWKPWNVSTAMLLTGIWLKMNHHQENNSKGNIRLRAGTR